MKRPVSVILIIFCLLSYIEWGISAQTGSGGSAQPTQDEVTRELKELSKRVAEVEEELKEEKKDIWDKISSVSGLASGVLIAFIGALATYVYNERQRKSEIEQNKRQLKSEQAQSRLLRLSERAESARQLKSEQAENELQRKSEERQSLQVVSVSQAQTILSLIPYLISNNPKKRKAALLVTEVMDRPELTTKVAKYFADLRSLGALYKISDQRHNESKKEIDMVIGDLLSIFKPSVVQIVRKSSDYSATGFFLSRKGHIITTGHVVGEEEDFIVRTEDGQEYSASVEKVVKSKDLALLKCFDMKFDYQPLKISSIKDILVHQQVAIMGHSVTMSWQVHIGRVSGVITKFSNNFIGPLNYSGRTLIEVRDLRTEMGFSGAPVIDQTGKVIGIMSFSRKNADVSYLIPGDDIIDAFPKLFEEKAS